MQRRTVVVVTLLGAILGLAGCGQPLALPAGNSAARNIETATPGVPNQVVPTTSVAEGSGNPPAGPTTITIVPEVSAPPASNPPAAPASDAPPPAEARPTPTVDPEFSNVTLPGPQDRWRYVQVGRAPFESVRTYTTPSRQLLWWYDPVFGQPVKLGEIQGDFPVQATFRFRGQEVDALEVPYQVNQSFGITLPDAIRSRMQNAGITEWAETFVYQTQDIRPK